MSNLIVVFFFICFSLWTSVFRVRLMRTMITMTKMTALKIKMAKMGPKKAPKNTPISSIKHLGGRKGTQIIKSECHGAVLYIISNLQSWVNNSIIFFCGPAYNKVITDCIWEVYSQWDCHGNDWYHWGRILCWSKCNSSGQAMYLPSRLVPSLIPRPPFNLREEGGGGVWWIIVWNFCTSSRNFSGTIWLADLAIISPVLDFRTTNNLQVTELYSSHLYSPTNKLPIVTRVVKRCTFHLVSFLVSYPDLSPVYTRVYV